MGTAATVTYKRLASLLGTKHSQPFSRTMGWLRCRISFSLLRSEVTYLRGARSTPGHPVAPTCISDTNLDLFTSEAMALTYQRLFLFCTKFLFSCSLKHFQVLFYINFVMNEIFNYILGRGSQLSTKDTNETMQHTTILITVSASYIHAQTEPIDVIQVIINNLNCPLGSFS